MTTRYPLRTGESWRDPWDDYAWLRNNEPVHRVDHDEHGTFWVLSRFADVFAAVRDTDTFCSSAGLTPAPDSQMVFEENAAPIVMMDPPIHTAMRRLVSGPMTPRQVAPIEPMIVDFVDLCLDQVADEGDVDIIEALFKPLPSVIVAHFLGVPASDRTAFDDWTNAIVAANADGSIRDASDAMLELFGFATELIERRKIEPGNDLVSDLVAAGEGSASVDWIVGFVFTMVAGGNDTTTGLLGGAAELITDNWDERRVLIEDPTLIRGSIEELLRLTTPVQNLARTTTRGVSIHGVDVPADHKVMLLYGAANRDERVFGPTAESLDVTRKIDKMLSFGYGAHHCLGAASARLGASIALERLLARFPDFVVDASAGTFAPGSFVRRYETLPFSAS